MIRALHRLATVVMVAGAALVPASAAVAATPAPVTGDTAVVYTGTATTTSDNPQFNAADTTTFPAKLSFDCASSPCTVVFTIVDTADPGNVSYSLGGSPRPYVPGQPIHVAASGGSLCDDDDYIPAGDMTITVTGDALSATRTFDQTGVFDCPDGSTAAIPAGYRMVVSATVSSGRACLVDGSCPTPAPTPSATPVVLAAGTPLPITPHFAGTHFSDPSTLSALPTTAAAVTPRNLVWAVAASVVLVILIALPSFLLDSTTEKLTERIGAWWRRVRPRRSPAEARSPWWRDWLIAVAGVVLASIVSAIADPSFGVNGGTVRVILSILVSFVLDVVVGWFVLILVMRRLRPGAPSSVRFAPLSLLVVAVAVLFTRLTGFQPAIVFGLVAGVAFGTVLATADRARAALIGIGYSFVVGALGWIGYSLVTAAAGAHPPTGMIFVQETLSATAIGGIAALTIALVPLRGLTGGEIFAWNRWVWAALYALGLFGFFLVLMPMPFSWQTVPLSLWAWIGIFVAYAAAAVLVWLLAARPWRREADEAEVEAA